MEVKEMQEKANDIIEMIDKKLNVSHDSDKTMIHLTEELGEIARQLNNKNIRNIPQSQENIEEEIADVVVLLNRLASINKIDVEAAILKKFNKLKLRHSLDI